MSKHRNLSDYPGRVAAAWAVSLVMIAWAIAVKDDMPLFMGLMGASAAINVGMIAIGATVSFRGKRTL